MKYENGDRDHGIYEDVNFIEIMKRFVFLLRVILLWRLRLYLAPCLEAPPARNASLVVNAGVKLVDSFKIYVHKSRLIHYAP